SRKAVGMIMSADMLPKLPAKEKHASPKLRPAVLLASSSDASPCGVSWCGNADASFRDTRRTGGRKRTESAERRGCPCRQSATLAVSRHAQYPLFWGNLTL